MSFVAASGATAVGSGFNVTMSQATDRFGSGKCAGSSFGSSSSPTSAYASTSCGVGGVGWANYSGSSSMSSSKTSSFVTSIVSSFAAGTAASNGDVASAARSCNVWMPQSY